MSHCPRRTMPRGLSVVLCCRFEYLRTSWDALVAQLVKRSPFESHPGQLFFSPWKQSSPGCSWLVCFALPFYLVTSSLTHALFILYLSSRGLWGRISECSSLVYSCSSGRRECPEKWRPEYGCWSSARTVPAAFPSIWYGTEPVE